MNALITKAKFNTEKILNGKTIYAEDFIELVIRYRDKIIKVEEEIFGGYELELEGSTFALDKDEIILIGINAPNNG